MWIDCQPDPQRVLGPQLFVSTCPCTPRCGFPSPGSPVPGHVIFLLLLFLTIRPVNSAAAASSLSFSDSIHSKSASRPQPFSARHRPFLACDVILAESRFAKPVASTAPFVNRARQHPNHNLKSNPESGLTARARGIGIQQFTPPRPLQRVSVFWFEISRCSLSEVRKFDFSRQPRITSQFLVVPSRFHHRPLPIAHRAHRAHRAHHSSPVTHCRPPAIATGLVLAFFLYQSLHTASATPLSPGERVCGLPRAQ